jgi:chromosome segregation ATPase
MKFLGVLVLFLALTLTAQAQQVDYNGNTYKIKGKTILKDKEDVTNTLSVEDQTGIFEALSKQKAIEAERKEAEKAIKKAESEQKKAEKKQKKAEKELKAKEKAQSNFEDANDDYIKAISKYEKLKNRGKLSPNDEAKWLEKIQDLKEDIDKAKRKL